MAPLQDRIAGLLQKRYIDCPGNSYWSNRYNRCVNGSAWYWYGRWIFTGVIILLFFLVFFLWARRNSRGRRRRGMAPMYGTGWMAPNSGQQYNNPQGYSNNGYSQPPPPPYGGAPQQSYPMENRYPPNDGQYGQQASGVEPPKNVYHGDYAPPAGPPPRK
ncbi:chitin synthesis regulation, resistance to congo red-domain-containing protein [Xylariaceae sp. FL0594]|nr:chitin synthesis regulation, resistance to congo red-domain-containing protein [Xylariaceae sp. FL0594]